MRLFVDIWNDPILIGVAEGKFSLKEQDLLLHLILEHPKLRERVGFIPQRIINAYQDLEWEEDVFWHPGDLVVHFVNCVYVLHIFADLLEIVGTARGSLIDIGFNEKRLFLRVNRNRLHLL